MKRAPKYDRLLVYMYNEWDAGHNDHKRGEKVRVLVERFEHNFPKNKIGSASDKKTAIAYLRDDGLIEVVDTAGKAITDPDQAYSTGRMKPTNFSPRLLHVKVAVIITGIIEKYPALADI
jgi:hypothetical protein